MILPGYGGHAHITSGFYDLFQGDGCLFRQLLQLKIFSTPRYHILAPKITRRLTFWLGLIFRETG